MLAAIADPDIDTVIAGLIHPGPDGYRNTGPVLSRDVWIDDDDTVHFEPTCSGVTRTAATRLPVGGTGGIEARRRRWCSHDTCRTHAAAVNADIRALSIVVSTFADVGYFERAAAGERANDIVTRYHAARIRTERPPTIDNGTLEPYYREALSRLSERVADIEPTLRRMADVEAASICAGDGNILTWSGTDDATIAAYQNLDGPDITINAATARQRFWGTAISEVHLSSEAATVTVPFLCGIAAVARGAAIDTDASDGTLAAVLVAEGWPTTVAGLRELVDTIGAINAAA